MKFTALFISLLFVFTTANAQSLTEQLEERAKASSEKSSKEIKQTMKKSLDELKASKIVEKAIKSGDSMPQFELPDVKRGMVDSKDLLKKGPLLIVFYRGGWCPYCNLQLRDLQKHLSDITKLGAQLVAISPQAPDNTRDTVNKSDLEFYVLSDINGTVSEKFGLTFKLDKDLIELYKKFGIDLEKQNANKKWELPLAATYIVNSDGKVVYSFVDEDYKKRAETADLIAELKKLKKD